MKYAHLIARCHLTFSLALFVGALAATSALGNTHLRHNQLGYQPADRKVAIALLSSEAPSEFKIVDAKSGTPIHEGKTELLREKWGQFAEHVLLDFSSLQTPGEYVIVLGEERSRPFRISSDVYRELPDQLLDFMRQQRCGYNPWVDEVCHPLDGRTADGPLPAGTYVDARGGWHDAGDQLKYLLTSSNATAQMLLAYLLKGQTTKGADADEAEAPSMFADRFNQLGQRGSNGIADVLDEARWGLDWMLRLHPAPDQLYHQVADDRDHNGFRLPHKENVDYGWGPGSYRVVYSADGKPQGLQKYKSETTGIANLAGRYSAAMALGYQVWKDDPRLAPYAQQLLQAGREVYAMGKAKEGVQQGNSYKAPYRYAETTWTDDMEWGAVELYRATGDKTYLDDAIRYAKQAATEGWFDQEQIGHYQFYPFMNVAHFRLYDLVDEATKKELANFYKTQIEACVERSKSNPYRVGMPFIWCSNNLAVALATQGAMYEKMTGDAKYREMTSYQRDWLSGRNPWGYTMFTEMPANGRFPTDVHLFGIPLLKKSVRGGLVDGPVKNSIFSSLLGVTIRQPDPLADFQDERAVFHDDIHDYSTNEPTMDGTASAILMWAVLSSD